MSWLITGTQKEPPSPYLLNTFPAAAAAYSLRQLRTGNTNVVRVRRSSDNTEADFTAAQVSNGTLTAFCGAGNGFVRTWYDQSGNGLHLIQSVSNNQPRCVDNGALILENTKPCLSFTGSPVRLGASVSNLAISDFYCMSVCNFKTLQSRETIFDIRVGTGSSAVNLFQESGSLRVESTQNLGGNLSIQAGTLYLAGFSTTASATTLILNNSTQSVSRQVFSGSSATLNIGFNAFSSGSLFLSGSLSEIVFYNSSQTSQRAALEANINAYYAVY